MIFDPFENRLCRDIRNTAGRELVHSLRQSDFEPFDAFMTSQVSGQDLPDCAVVYLENRKKGLYRILEKIPDPCDENNRFWETARLLWNNELFFEFHEWIEEKWQAKKGDEKKGLQALILSSIVYEHMTYKRREPAFKVALKALALFKNYSHTLPAIFDIGLLAKKLAEPEAPPPKICS